jgi:hypothetical protein
MSCGGKAGGKKPSTSFPLLETPKIAPRRRLSAVFPSCKDNMLLIWAYIHIRGGSTGGLYQCAFYEQVTQHSRAFPREYPSEDLLPEWFIEEESVVYCNLTPLVRSTQPTRAKRIV